MKKVKSANRRSIANANSTPKNVDEYLARVPEPAYTTLKKMRAAIRSAMPPQADEAISYGIPAFNYKGTRVWFAAFSKENSCRVASAGPALWYTSAAISGGKT
jgi:hypothetical protein